MIQGNFTQGRAEVLSYSSFYCIFQGKWQMGANVCKWTYRIYVFFNEMWKYKHSSVNAYHLIYSQQ